MIAMEDHELWGWSSFFGRIEQFLTEAQRQYGVANVAYTSYVIERLEMCISNVRHLVDHLSHFAVSPETREVVDQYRPDLNALCHSLELLSTQWEKHADHLNEMDVSQAYHPPLESSRRRGRPRVLITREQLQYLSSLSFSWTEIAAILGVSRMTLYRRRVEYDMLQDQPSQSLTDDQLLVILREMRVDHPQFGETMAMGHMRARGYHVTRQRLRHAVHATDPINTALRWRGGLTSRRPYSVPGPNSLWHIDGHHKLVRWRLVTHAGVDGYSRLVVFVHCSTNNRASTVYNSFVKAIQHYGLPSRVRSDQGRENMLVAQHMLEHRGVDRGSMIVGSSVHNQRVERLWRDLHRCVTQQYYRLFYYLENQGVLDPVNEYHLFALHYVYTPRLNRALMQFKESWNNHSIRTERGHSPNQLFAAGALLLQGSGLTAMDFFEQVNEHVYGVEDEGLTTSDEQVAIPESRVRLTPEHSALLQQSVDPMSDSDNHGIELYHLTLHILRTIVEQHPNQYP